MPTSEIIKKELENLIKEEKQEELLKLAKNIADTLKFGTA